MDVPSGFMVFRLRLFALVDVSLKKKKKKVFEDWTLTHHEYSGIEGEMKYV